MASRNWTRDELVVAFNLYCKIPFGKIHNRNPEIIAIAQTLGRSASAVSWKLVNFASIDPSIKESGRVGAQHGSKLDKEVWEEFNGDWERLSYESETLLAGMTGQNIEQIAQISLNNEVLGKEREAIVRVRVNQSFFRASVLAAYNFRCCISGLAVPELLNASHIVPWAIDATNRVNPRNGLCLNALLDRAFDRGLITITPKYTVKISKSLKIDATDDAVKELLYIYDEAALILPQRFTPDVNLLAYHNCNIYRGET